jgi:hypothetical protein
MKKDCRFVQAHTEFLQARTAQSAAMAELVESRVNLATVVAKLQTIDEIIQHEYARGRAERQSEVAQWQHSARLAALERERHELNAQADLLRAQQRLAELQPQPSPPPPEPPPAPPPPPAPGLSPADVEEVLTGLPEISTDTLKTISRLLLGLLKEKSG